MLFNFLANYSEDEKLFDSVTANPTESTKPM